MQRALIFFTVLALAVGACAGDDGDDTAATPETTQDDTDTAAPDATPTTSATNDRGFVGEVDGTDAYIAVVSGTTEAVAYVCDGDADIAEWFRGPVDADGHMELTNDGGATLDATIGDGVTGAITFADGSTHDVAATAATGDAGLYRIAGDDPDVVGGWVVGLDGTARGSLRVRGIRKTAAPEPTATVEVDGRTFDVVVFAEPSGPGGPIPVPYPTFDRVATTTTASTVPQPSN